MKKVRVAPQAKALGRRSEELYASNPAIGLGSRGSLVISAAPQMCISPLLEGGKIKKDIMCFSLN